MSSISGRSFGFAPRDVGTPGLTIPPSLPLRMDQILE
jgi:hypothetical protein